MKWVVPNGPCRPYITGALTEHMAYESEQTNLLKIRRQFGRIILSELVSRLDWPISSLSLRPPRWKGIPQNVRRAHLCAEGRRVVIITVIINQFYLCMGVLTSDAINVITQKIQRYTYNVWLLNGKLVWYYGRTPLPTISRREKHVLTCSMPSKTFSVRMGLR